MGPPEISETKATIPPHLFLVTAIPQSVRLHPFLQGHGVGIYLTEHNGFQRSAATYELRLPHTCQHLLSFNYTVDNSSIFAHYNILFVY